MFIKLDDKSDSELAAYLKPLEISRQSQSLTKHALSLFVFIFNKQNQLLVVSVYSLPVSIALQSKQLDHSIVLSI